MAKRKCKHKECSTEVIQLPKGTEFSPEIYSQMVILRCLVCREVIEIKYY